MAATKVSKYSAIVLAIIALALTITTTAVINVNQNVSSGGSITTSPNIGVYSDSGCTNNMTSITWGTVAAGSAVTQTVYVKNTGTGTMTLSLAASNWNPAGASTYITVGWNQQNTVLTAGQSVAAIITLTVSPSITGITTFTHTITITGTG
jgi:hypothetical protein